MNNSWSIWIDTGGTFTDCIAVDPAGMWHRAKVLSTGRLRGRLLEKAGPGSYRLEQQWRTRYFNIFEGYSITLPGNDQTFARVTDICPDGKNLSLDKEIEFDLPLDIDLHAGEEAPVLATRLITGTGLRDPFPRLQTRLGSTRGTNALLERKGAKVALLITKGFADLPLIGTQQRPDLFQLDIPPPENLATVTFEIPERLNASGEVLEALKDNDVDAMIENLHSSDVSSVAISLLHAFRNPAHEEKLSKALRAAGIRHVSVSSALSPSIKLLPRTRTALVNAYLDPVIENYLTNIRNSFGGQASNLRVMTSSGGLVSAETFAPKDSLLSGPAGGVVAAAEIARQVGFPKVLTLDMGGTSTDTARYDGYFDYRYVTTIDGFEILSPTLAIETVAAGGGSLCGFDGHKLFVGPQSAGASPGPACYGAGGPFTITDVNLLLGKLDPEAMGIPVSPKNAQEALDELCREMLDSTDQHYEPLEVLRGLEQIADEKMAEAIRRISVARGFDATEYALLSFGGAGGLHACRLAELLDLDNIILPFDAGLLSAFGMGCAMVERFVEKQVLNTLEACKESLPEIIEALALKAKKKVEEEGFTAEEVTLSEILISLRFQGQESALEVRLQSPEEADSLAGAFEKEYKNLFGHFPAGRTIEVANVRVKAASSAKVLELEKGSFSSYSPKPHRRGSQGSNSGAAVYYWESLRPGAYIEGPAILLSPFATAFVGKGWRLEMKAGKNAVLHRESSSLRPAKTQKEAIEMELFTNRFTAIAEEMGAQLQRTSFSVNIKERLDFSCALLDPDCRLLVNAPHIPVHLGSLGICARLVLEKVKLEPGDVVITNHPKYGGSHLPDLTLLAAVFDDDHELIGYVINRAHHAEIGGSRPGSMPPDARKLSEEGVAIVPTYLANNGEVNWQMLEGILTGGKYPTRSLSENIADINAALASLRTGENALKALVAKQGRKKVGHYMRSLHASARQAMQDALGPMEGRSFSAVEKMDDGRPINLFAEVKDGKLLLDFEGTGGVHPHNLNANISIVYSAVMYLLRLLCGKNIPLNDGLMEAVEIKLPPGTFLNPDFEDDPEACPAVVGGNTEVSQRLVDTLLKAFGLAACSQGTMNNFLFGNDRFGYYETIGGGAGAVKGHAGRSAVHQHMTNTRITDPEDLEFRYPVRLLRFAIRRGSGGKGRWPGGDGIIREFLFPEAMQVTILSQHRVEAPYGLAGGQPGATGKQELIDVNGDSTPLRGMDSVHVEAGQRVIIWTPGGGGFSRSSTSDFSR